jgi:hypothetical protein
MHQGFHPLPTAGQILPGRYHGGGVWQRLPQTLQDPSLFSVLAVLLVLLSQDCVG